MVVNLSRWPVCLERHGELEKHTSECIEGASRNDWNVDRPSEGNDLLCT